MSDPYGDVDWYRNRIAHLTIECDRLREALIAQTKETSYYNGTDPDAKTDSRGYTYKEKKYLCAEARKALQEAEADARLIAAAPDMLDALEKGVEIESSDLVGVEFKQALYSWLKDARTAIAKAKGGDV